MCLFSKTLSACEKHPVNVRTQCQLSVLELLSLLDKRVIKGLSAAWTRLRLSDGDEQTHNSEGRIPNPDKLRAKQLFPHEIKNI